MFTKPKTLIVIFKDEMLANQVRKLVETKDDTDDSIVGTRDDSVKVVPWSEKVWLANKKAGNIDSKILFLGDIKGVDKLIPLLDIKFNEYGVKYGWAGDQAVIFCDSDAVKDKAEYNAFLDKISDLPIPEVIKNANRPKEEGQPEEIASAPESADATEQNEKTEDLIDRATDAYVRGLNAFSAFWMKAGSDAVDHVQDLFRDKSAVKKQLLFYGIIQLYNNHLEEFLNN